MLHQPSREMGVWMGGGGQRSDLLAFGG